MAAGALSKELQHRQQLVEALLRDRPRTDESGPATDCDDEVPPPLNDSNALPASTHFAEKLAELEQLESPERCQCQRHERVERIRAASLEISCFLGADGHTGQLDAAAFGLPRAHHVEPFAEEKVCEVLMDGSWLDQTLLAGEDLGHGQSNDDGFYDEEEQDDQTEEPGDGDQFRASPLPQGATGQSCTPMTPQAGGWPLASVCDDRPASPALGHEWPRDDDDGFYDEDEETEEEGVPYELANVPNGPGCAADAGKEPLRLSSSQPPKIDGAASEPESSSPTEGTSQLRPHAPKLPKERYTRRVPNALGQDFTMCDGCRK